MCSILVFTIISMVHVLLVFYVLKNDNKIFYLRDNFHIIRMFICIRVLYSNIFPRFLLLFNLEMIFIYLLTIFIVSGCFFNVNMGRRSFLFATPSSCRIFLCSHNFSGPSSPSEPKAAHLKKRHYSNFPLRLPRPAADLSLSLSSSFSALRCD